MSTRWAASAALALLFNATVWGLSWLPFKALNQLGLHPLWATTLVFFAVFCVLLRTERRVLGVCLQDRRLWVLAVAAGCTNVGFNWAVTVGDVVRVVLLFYLMPVWSIVFALYLLREVPSRAALLRVALALLGVSLVLGKPGTWWPLPETWADWLALGAGACFAFTNVMLRLLHQQPAGARATAMMAGGALMAGATAMAAAALGVVAPLGGPSLAWWPWLLALTLGFFASNHALQFGAARLPAQITALIMLSEVVIASLSSVALGHAEPSALTWLGGLLIVGAAGLAVLRR